MLAERGVPLRFTQDGHLQAMSLVPGVKKKKRFINFKTKLFNFITGLIRLQRLALWRMTHLNNNQERQNHLLWELTLTALTFSFSCQTQRPSGRGMNFRASLTEMLTSVGNV